jgi:hypothetical protein
MAAWLMLVPGPNRSVVSAAQTQLAALAKEAVGISD